MLKLKITASFQKDIKRMRKRNKDEKKLSIVINKLLKKEPLEEKYRDHKLVNYSSGENMRECHIEPDWLLVYNIDDEYLVLSLIRTDSHSDLF